MVRRTARALEHWKALPSCLSYNTARSPELVSLISAAVESLSSPSGSAGLRQELGQVGRKFRERARIDDLLLSIGLDSGMDGDRYLLCS